MTWTNLVEPRTLGLVDEIGIVTPKAKLSLRRNPQALLRRHLLEPGATSWVVRGMGVIEVSGVSKSIQGDANPAFVITLRGLEHEHGNIGYPRPPSTSVTNH